MYQKIKALLSTSLFKETVTYGLTNALYTGLPLLLMPFLVTIMSPADYGLADLFKSIALFMTPVLGLSTVQAITRFYYDLKEKSFKVFCSSIILFHIAMALFALLLIGLSTLFIDSKYLILLFLAVVYFLFNQITEALLSIYRLKRQAKSYLIVRLILVILNLTLLTICYFIYNNYDWTYQVIPNVLSVFTVGLTALLLLHRQFGISTQFKKSLLWQAIIFSAPLIAHMIAGYILNVGDRFLIIYYLDEKVLGDYSVAYQLGMSISFVFTSFNLAWMPTFFEWMKKGKYNSIRKIKKLVYLGLAGISAVIITLWISFSDLLVSYQKYSISNSLVVIIVVAYFFLSLYRFNSAYFFYYKNTKLLAKISTFSALCSILLNIYFIPHFGIMGAGITTLIAFVIMYLTTAYWLRKLKSGSGINNRQ